ncbi:MAG: lipoyl synthase [Planctomycetes bacterium]|nr:lipoyl synthase [Planctomycetota bacterium]NUQ35541.1 lipoyl synthase [Planctomycetaceae bacterium]
MSQGAETHDWRSRHTPGDGVVRTNPELERRPGWLKVTTPTHGTINDVERIVHGNALHTVCESASCPNRGECWGRGTATLMILGNICTRSCGFCGVKTGRPTEYDMAEPERVAEAVAVMKLSYVVITSVDRDDLKDGGSTVWAATINAVRNRCPETGIEVLIPDFRGVHDNQDRVFDARPHVLAHNLETVETLTKHVRPQADYRRSLETIARAKTAGLVTKSGIMLGLGEEKADVLKAIRDLRHAGCDILTIGQYMQPTRNHLAVMRWVHPDEFAEYRAFALSEGFRKVDSGPLVRSSYRAEEVMEPGSELADAVKRAIAATTSRS